jgi:Ca2+-binding EF-hand superfamily protein
MDQIQRLREIDPKLIDDMQNEVRQLFTTFDTNKDGFITPDEIKLAMMAIGRNVTLEEAAAIIRTVDSNGDGRLDQREFCELMLQKMKEELLGQEDNIEHLRAYFLDADVDHSGTLSVNEIYGVLLKMGADLTLEELIQLMNEIDTDRNGSLDIDEFVALMTVTGNEMEFASETSKKTLQTIRKCRRLQPLDFLK